MKKRYLSRNFFIIVILRSEVSLQSGGGSILLNLFSSSHVHDSLACDHHKSQVFSSILKRVRAGILKEESSLLCLPVAYDIVEDTS